MTQIVACDVAIEVAPYRPGGPLRALVRGVLTRFLPASVTMFGCGALPAIWAVLTGR